MKSPEVQPILASKIKEAESNCNYMEPEKFDLLKKAIEVNGFLQPILVRPDGKDFVIIDGHHRFKAAVEIGFEAIPCVVAEFDDNEATLESISMNKLRGELNLTMVAHDLAGLVGEGWDVKDLATSGFNTEEIAALIESTKDFGEDDFNLDDLPSEPTSVKEKTKFSIEIRFSSEKDLSQAKTRLDDLVAADGDYGKLLLKLLTFDG